MNTQNYTLPIAELFSIMGLSSIDNDCPEASPHTVLINSPAGYVPINQFVKKHHTGARYFLESGNTLDCSTQHIVFSDNVPKLISTCNIIDTANGPDKIVGVEALGEIDVYDVALDYPHQYVTPNGIIHHNTSLAKVLINEIGIEEYDVLVINASRDNGVDFLREKIVNFVQMIPFGPFKVVLLDEADGLSPAAQGVLRGVMETYASTSRFILTCNYPNKIIPALHSRCQGFQIEKTDQTEFTARVATILISENVEFELDTLDTFVKIAYPDLRKCINLVQQNVVDGRLISPSAGNADSTDYKIEMVTLFKAGEIQKARKLLCSKARPEEMEEIYRFCYDNLDLFGKTEEQKDSAVVIIKQGLVDHVLCGDSEINLSATMVKLARNYAS